MLQAHGDLVSAVDFGNEFLVAGFEDGSLGVWSLQPIGKVFLRVWSLQPIGKVFLRVWSLQPIGKVFLRVWSLQPIGKVFYLSLSHQFVWPANGKASVNETWISWLLSSVRIYTERDTPFLMSSYLASTPLTAVSLYITCLYLLQRLKTKTTAT